MANNRMYLFNTRTKQQVFMAKYYPSTGWYFIGDAQQALADAFHKADFGDLTEEQERANATHEGFGVPFPAANSDLEGAEWEVRYEWHPDETKRTESGIRDVVTALRDEIYASSHMDSDYFVSDWMNEILASDGVEAEYTGGMNDLSVSPVKAAGGSTREDGHKDNGLTVPAGPKPAADFCEWEKLRTSWGFRTSCSTKWLMNENYGGDTCPLCEKAIKYKFPEGSE